jgi:hypothetical protein
MPALSAENDTVRLVSKMRGMTKGIPLTNNGYSWSNFLVREFRAFQLQIIAVEATSAWSALSSQS